MGAPDEEAGQTGEGRRRRNGKCAAKGWKQTQEAGEESAQELKEGASESQTGEAGTTQAGQKSSGNQGSGPQEKKDDQAAAENRAGARAASRTSARAFVSARRRGSHSS